MLLRPASGAVRALAIVAALLFAAPSLAFAQDAISAPAQKTIGFPRPKLSPSLIVVNARGATLEGARLTLTGVAANAILFADRPVRAAGHALTAQLLKEWSGAGSFAKDPPNATVSVLSADGSSVRDAVIVLRAPKSEDDKLTFDVQVLEGSLAGADGPASVFIDTLDMPVLSWLAGGPARATADQAAWYHSNGDYAEPPSWNSLGPAFMNNGEDTTPWQ
jgi:hypothetical protein